MAKGKDSLIGPICEGNSPRFSGNSCQNYEADVQRTCRLLKEQGRNTFWKQCRAQPWELLYNMVDACLKTLQETYSTLIDEGDDFDYAVVLERLNKAELNIANLAVWTTYAKTAVYHEIRRQLDARNGIPERHNCGTCKSLTESTPYQCLKQGEERNKTDKACDDYKADIPQFAGLDEHGSHHNATTHHTTPLSLLMRVETESLLEQIPLLLQQRADEQESGSKQQKKCLRQAERFMLYIQLLSEGLTEKDANRALIQKEYQGKKKTFYRDLEDVREFLKEKMSPFD